MAETVPAVLVEAAAERPELEAVVDGDVRLTFAELEIEARRTAAALVAAGIEPGDRVAIWAPNSAAWVVASFGVYAAGAVLVPLNTRYRGDEAGHILRTSGARMLLTVGDFLGTDYATLLDGVEGLADLERVVHLDTEEWATLLDEGTSVGGDVIDARIAALDEHHTCDILFTSGTTGEPKGAMLTHGASVETFRAWSDLVDLREGDRQLCVFPFFHTGGLKAGILASALRRAAIHPQSTFDVPTVLDVVATEGITMLPGPPTVFQMMINHPERENHDLSSLRSAVTGAAVVPVETVREIREVLGIRTVVTGYGMTETTGTISMCRYDDPPEVIAHTVGRPIPGVEVRIADDGEICARGFNLMQGYFGNPEATAETIVDGWLHTGDIGCIDDDGNLRITDRKKDMFIVGGFNAYPAEIEKVLVEHPAVAQATVIGVPDERMGERGLAFVVPASGADLDTDSLLEWAWERLAKFKLSEIRTIDELPLNPTGKVQKFKLREQD